MEGNRTDINQYTGYILKFIQQYIKVSEQDLIQFIPYFEVRTFSKREEVLRYGQTDDYLNLVVKGLLRKYVLVGKNEKTLQLAIEGKVIQSEVSFHTRVPSNVIIEALEPSIVVSMRYDNVLYVLDNIPVAETDRKTNDDLPVH